MTNINELGNGLSGQTGTGSFVGSANPVLTGNNDLSGATVLRIPASAAPSVSTTGQIALDTTVSGYPGLIKYYDGTQEMSVLGMASADFNATDGYVISYNSASSKLEMVAQSAGGAGKIVQYVIQTSTTTDTTTSTSFVSSSLSASITPTSSSNLITCICSLYFSAAITSGSVQAVGGIVQVQRTTQTPTAFVNNYLGNNLGSATSLSRTTLKSYKRYFTETISDTTLRTYEAQFQAQVSGITASILGATYPAFMMLLEIEP